MVLVSVHNEEKLIEVGPILHKDFKAFYELSFNGHFIIGDN